MEEKDVLRFLRCESSDLVEFAVKMANLTWKEELAITLCGRKDKTQNQAAEESGFSVDTMQKWYRRGIEKLGRAWAGIALYLLIGYSLPRQFRFRVTLATATAKQ